MVVELIAGRPARGRNTLTSGMPGAWKRKLTADMVQDGRRRYWAKEVTISELATEQGVRKPTVSNYLRRMNWRWLPLVPGELTGSVALASTESVALTLSRWQLHLVLIGLERLLSDAVERPGLADLYSEIAGQSGLKIG